MQMRTTLYASKYKERDEKASEGDLLLSEEKRAEETKQEGEGLICYQHGKGSENIRDGEMVRTKCKRDNNQCVNEWRNALF